jgi:hypothetical protein
MNSHPHWSSGPVKDDIPIRNGLRSKLLYFWRATFDDFLRILNAAEGLEQILAIGSMNEIDEKHEGEESFNYKNELAFSLHLAIPEVIDDYWAAYLCLLNGFTKQSQQILRNTLELVLQMLYLSHLDQTTGFPVDDWTAASRGIGRIPDKIATLSSKLDALQPGLSVRLEKLYNLLCMSTHSHKHRMSSLRMPRTMMTGDMPSLEPTEILYSRAAFLAVLDLELRLMRVLVGDWNDEYYRSAVQQKLDAMLDVAAKYRRTIESFHKGYLLHREHAMLSDGTQIVYSFKLNGEAECPGSKRMLTKAQARELRQIVDERLLKDRP